MATRSSLGYTLIELIVVVAIGGLLAAVVAPRFFDQSVFAQRGYADELGAALRSARKAAVISGCAAQLVVQASSYAARQQAASGNACNPSDATWATPVLTADGSGVAGTAPSGVTAAPTGTYAFDSQGRLTSAPATTLAVGARSIVIDASTGYVRVQ